jgi:outer membrane protein TolC
MRLGLVIGCLSLVGCVSAATEAEWDALKRDVAALPAPDPSAPVPAELEREARLELILATAHARSPALRRALGGARAALERVGQAAAWEDLVFKFMIDDGQVASPLAFDRAAMLMVGFMQMIPALGAIDAKTAAAVMEGRRALEEYRVGELELSLDVRRTFARYVEATRAHETHAAHERILEDFEKLADVKYRAGTVPQTDVLKAQIERSRLRTEIAMNRKDAAVAAAKLNQLMHRPHGAVLGPPAAAELEPTPEELASLQQRALETRPEMRAARWAIEAARAQARLAGVEATVPQFNVEALYGIVSRGDDQYDASVGINLPWINPGRSARRREAGHELTASEDAVVALADQVVYEVRAAHAEAEAGRAVAELYRAEILDRTRAAVEVARRGYENNTSGFLDLLDAERTLRDAELEYARARARAQEAAADLERAVGTDLPRKP